MTSACPSAATASGLAASGRSPSRKNPRQRRHTSGATSTDSLISRNASRHPGYIAELRAAGIEATSHPVDVLDRAALLTVLKETGAVDVLYYGPGAADAVLPGMLERGTGALLFAGGLSSVVPMPMLGSLAVSAAALRNYAVTLHAGLADRDVYAGTLTIGGLIERGDIHHMITSRPGGLGDMAVPSLNPTPSPTPPGTSTRDGTPPEAVFNALA